LRAARIVHHFATTTGGQVSGYNIDTNQLENADEWAAKCGMSSSSRSTNWTRMCGRCIACSSRGRATPARNTCSPPDFDWNSDEHVALHRPFLPTLAATQSMYPADVCVALEPAGFRVLVSATSKSEAWPLCEQKTALIRRGGHVVKALAAVHLAPEWATESLDLLQKGGAAWNAAERAKIADLNWRIVAQKA
jgi:sterol 24-C-methyltransferase